MSLAGRTVGFVGLGLMGKPMARNLAKAGAAMVIHSRSPGPVDELAAEGMTPADSPGAVARAAETVILSLTDTPAVETVIEGKNGILEGVHGGSLIIDMGTTAVTATRRLAKRVEEKGGDYVDAPVSGGTIGAEGGTLVIMAGGSEAAMARAQPLFDVLGSKTTHVGGTGTGQVAKAANQVIVGLTIGAVAEALTLAKRAGADPEKVRQAFEGGFADSRIREVHGQRMTSGDFTPGGKAVTQRKDMDQAIALAEELGFDLPASRLNRDLYDRLIAAGDGELDHAALFKVIDVDGQK